MPPPMTTTRPGATPGTPPSSKPRPPSGFSRKYAPAWAASRPAISLTGAGLDGDVVSALAELTRARRRERDAVLVGLDSLGDADLQAASPYLARVTRLASVEIQEQSRERLGVLDLAHLRCDLVSGPADDLELFVTFRTRLAAVEALGKEEVHLLAAETGGRVERRHVEPGAARQARLLLQLSLRAPKRCLALLQRARRQLDELLAH